MLVCLVVSKPSAANEFAGVHSPGRLLQRNPGRFQWPPTMSTVVAGLRCCQSSSHLTGCCSGLHRHILQVLSPSIFFSIGKDSICCWTSLFAIPGNTS